MRNHRFQTFFNAILFIILTACGGGKSSPGAEKGPAALVPKDIRESWGLVSKTCEGVDKPLLPGEEYRLDGSHFVRIVGGAEDESSVCRLGYVYDKVLSGYGSKPSGGYYEHGALDSRALKKTCWQKKNGVRVEPPISEKVMTFGPERLTMKLASITAGALTVDLHGSQECAGTLTLGLIRK